MQIAEECVGGLLAEVGLDARGWRGSCGPAAKWWGWIPGRRWRCRCAVAAVGLDESLGLHEHAARAAAGVVDAALVRFEHLDQQSDDGARRVELAAELAFGLGELAEEVFVDAAERVAGLVAGALKPMLAIRSISPFILTGSMPRRA